MDRDDEGSPQKDPVHDSVTIRYNGLTEKPTTDHFGTIANGRSDRFEVVGTPQAMAGILVEAD